MGEGITQVRLQHDLTRVFVLPVAFYRVGNVIVDSGYHHVGDFVVSYMQGRPLDAILLTHHHEDHSGNAAALAEEHGCPVYLRNPEQRLVEGLSDLIFYRRLFWGAPEPYTPLEPPEKVSFDGHTLRPVPIPGHSVTHTAYFDEETGSVFVGDLFVTGGVTAVMTHENPFESIRSLRRVAALSPTRMHTGHGLTIRKPVEALKEKADRIEEAAKRTIELHRSGVEIDQIPRRVFEGGYIKDKLYAAITEGEFSRECFVRACIRHADDR